MKNFLIVIFCLLVCSQSCFAFDYYASCHYLDGIKGLSTTEDSMGCMSNYKLLDTNRSNLAYYTSGAKNYINEVYLVLNFYYGSNKQVMHNSLVQASKTLSQKAINYNLPQAIVTSLQNGNTGVWKHGSHIIRIKKEIFPSGRGYEIHFKIEE